MSKIERQGFLSSFRIGRMPEPRFINMDGPEGSQREVAICARCTDGTSRSLIFLRNFRLGDLKSEQSRDEAASLIARAELQTGLSSAIGPALLPDSSQDNPHKVLIHQGEITHWGFYIESNPDLVNIRQTVNDLAPEIYWRRNKHVDFDVRRNAAKAVLPKPQKTSKLKVIYQLLTKHRQ